MSEPAKEPLFPYEYTVVRVVPRVERGECLNAGVILVSRTKRFLNAKIALDRTRLRSFAPYLEEETIDLIERQLLLIPAICAGDSDAGPIAALGLQERWHWLSSPSSTIIQPAPVHTGICPEPARALEDLFTRFVRLPEGGGA